MSASDWVYPYPGSALTLAQVIEDADFTTVTCVALDALDALRPIWEPLSAEAVLVALEGNDPLTQSMIDVLRPHRLLVKSSASNGVRIDSVMTDPVTTTSSELSRCTIDAWLKDALREVAEGAGQHGEWTDLIFSACRAWVGPRDWRSNENELRLAYEGGAVVVPIERSPSGAWLSGPREPAFDQPPFAVRLSHQMGRLEVRLTRHYAYWLESSEPAARQFDDTVAKLRVMGWEE